MAFSERFGPLEETIKSAGKENRLHPNLVDLCPTSIPTTTIASWAGTTAACSTSRATSCGTPTARSSRCRRWLHSYLVSRCRPSADGVRQHAPRLGRTARGDAPAPGGPRRRAQHPLFAYSRSTIAKGLFDPEHERELAPVRQALVRSNPVNGRKNIHIGSHAWYIEGMPFEESRRLLDDLHTRTTRPETVY
jgi:hypothetical protein